ncbi:hypothetical protein [Lacihabitans sp. LS3-19]|uniref:hypothetical protein n=1 Tax=Lacihabitans sp. LS3-19 TaxID=2487335 RepID=UPI0020CDB827|nr:hypothetical protein [Lacihabitans sp. LS3-19]
MKKTVLILSLLFFGIAFNSNSASNADFFAGKWDMLIKGTPNGDAKMEAHFKIVNGKLSGTLKPSEGDAIPVTQIDEETDAITIYFSAQGYDLNVKLTKVDENNLKGSLMDMFETTLVRKASADYFAGKWEFLVVGTPQGDVKFTTELSRKDGKLTGELSNLAEPNAPKIPITSIEEEADKIVIFFSASGYDLDLNLSKVDADNLKGTMFNMFESKGVRVK